MKNLMNTFGLLLLVILLLFLLGPWIINIFSLEIVTDAYEAYVEWVGNLFHGLTPNL